MAIWIKTKHKGVRYREHPTRKYGLRKDRYYVIRFKLDGKDVGEALGWETDFRSKEGEKISLEEHAVLKLAELKRNRNQGGPVTLRGQRKEERAKRDLEEAKQKAKTQQMKTLVEYWQETYYPAAMRSKGECSWGKEEQHFRRWIGPLLGKLPMQLIGLKQWDELVKTLSTANLSQRSKEYITGTLRRIVRHAYDRRMVDDPPPTGKRIGVAGPGNNRRLRVITHQEETAIMDGLAAAAVHAWRITRFSFLTGCRASEAFRLRWENVQFQRDLIVFPETKNRDPRNIPLTQGLAGLFEGMDPGPTGTYVFTDKSGKPYTQAPATFSAVVQSLGMNQDRTRRDKLTFHSIRHTVATRLARDLGPRDLMDLLGWRTVQMAMRYVHGNEDAKTKALSMLGETSEPGKVLPFVKATG
jgi:integrase